MYKRILDLKISNKSFFLWGQRQTGKSSLLKSTFPDAYYINLLQSDEYLQLSSNPSLLKERLISLKKNRPKLVIIDEVQKIPMLLDEIHSLIENEKITFGLCGSSARKLKRGHANLLGGRARRFELLGFSAIELNEDFDLLKMLNRGYLPSHYLEEDYFLNLQSYVGDYLKEEIVAESLTRNIPAFTRFLEVAAQSDSEIINYSNISRETSVSVKTTQNHYEILVDTLTGNFLPAYIKKFKRRIIQAPKFYFYDIGIVNYLCRQKNFEFKTSYSGKAFENWVFHELTCFIKYSLSEYPLYYWRLTSGAEVDFILGDMEIALEAKAVPIVTSDHLKGLREIKIEHPKIKERLIVCLEKKLRQTEDGILIVPYKDFLNTLWNHPLKHNVDISFTKNL